MKAIIYAAAVIGMLSLTACQSGSSNNSTPTTTAACVNGSQTVNQYGQIVPGCTNTAYGNGLYGNGAYGSNSAYGNSACSGYYQMYGVQYVPMMYNGQLVCVATQ